MAIWREAPEFFVQAGRTAMAGKNSNWNSIAGYVQAALIAYASLQLFLRVYRQMKLHLPPSPPGLPFLGNWLQFRKGLNPQILAQMAKQYGEVCLLRMGQRNVVVLSSPAMAKEVLQTQGVEFGSRSRNLVFEITTGGGQDMVFADYGDHWRKMRRIATLPFFTHKVVHKNRVAWEEEIDLALQEIHADPLSTTQGLIIRDRVQLAVYNIVYCMMFGRRFQSLQDPIYLELMRHNMENVRLGQSFEYNYGDYFSSLKPFLGRFLNAVRNANGNRLDFLRKAFLNERNKLGAKEKLGVDHFIDAQQRGEIGEMNVLYLVQNMNVAAIETSVWSSEWAVAELVNHPEIQEKLAEEMERVLVKGAKVTEPDIQHLPYLQAVVKEVLRHHMVIPMLVPHSNLEPAKLGNYDIPKGSRILVNAWAIANDPELWDRPEEFWPDRFLHEKIEANGSDFRFIPFGSGRRSCPGSILALPLLALIIGRIVQSFHLLPPPGQDTIDLAPAGGQLNMKIAKQTPILIRPRHCK